MQQTQVYLYLWHRLCVNKNTLTEVFSLACLEIRSRNEGAINSAQNRIYWLKVFYPLIYRHQYFLFVSESIQYMCKQPPEIHLQLQAIHMYKYTKTQGPRFQRNYMIARDQISDYMWHVISITARSSQEPFAYNESLQHPTIAVLLIKILIFFSTTQQCSLVPK